MPRWRSRSIYHPAIKIDQHDLSAVCGAYHPLKSPLCSCGFDHVAGSIVTGINALKKRVWADLFVTLGFGSLSQIAMSSALRVFTRGMFGFAEIIVVVTFVCLLVAIASILLPCAALLEWTALRPDRARHIGN